MAMTLVSTTTVPSGGAASIEFTNIRQTGKDLLVVFSGRNPDSPFVRLRFNGDTINYSQTRLTGDGSSVGTNLGDTLTLYSSVNSSTEDTFGNSAAYISSYTSAPTKSVSIDAVFENNGTAAFQKIQAGSFNNSAAITSLSISTFFGQIS